MNNSGLEVVGHRVLIKPKFQEGETDWGFALDVGDTFKRELGATDIGTVIAIGPNAWIDFKSLDADGNVIPGKPWCKVGDTVFFAKYSQKEIRLPNKEVYFVVNDEDVQCVDHRIEEEEKSND